MYCLRKETLINIALFGAMVCYCAFMLFDGNVSPDFRNYQYRWLNPSRFFLADVEVMYPAAAILVNKIILDFRLAILFFNAVIIFFLLRSGREGKYFLILLLFHPFTAFGFNNTLLSFTASLMAVVLLLRARLVLFAGLPILMHKGAILFAPFFFKSWSLQIFSFVSVGALVALASQKQGGSTYLGNFDVDEAAFAIKLLYVLFPVMLANLVRPSRSIFSLILGTLTIIVLFPLASKVADRFVYILSVLVILFVAQSVERMSPQNKMAFFLFWISWSAFGYMHPSVQAQF